jgi:hypothetical protein
MIIFNEKESLKEMAIVSTISDKGLENIGHSTSPNATK